MNKGEGGTQEVISKWSKWKCGLNPALPVGSKRKAIPDVLFLEIWKVSQDLLVRHPRREVLQDVDTVTRSPRIRGLPPRFPGSTVDFVAAQKLGSHKGQLGSNCLKRKAQCIAVSQTQETTLKGCFFADH